MNKEIKKVLGKEWGFGYERRMTYQRIRGFNYSHYYHFPRLFGVKLKYEIFRVRDGNVALYRESSENAQAFTVIENKLKSAYSSLFINKISKIIINGFKKFDVKNKKLRATYAHYSNKQLVDIYKSILKSDNEVALANRLTFTQFEEVLTNVIKQLSLSAHEISEILYKLSNPYKVTPIDRYKLDIIKILENKNVGLQEKQIIGFARKYIHWGMFDFNYEILDTTYHLNELKKIESLDFKLLKLEIEKKYKNQKKIISEILNKYKSNTHIYSLLNLYVTIANLKEWKNYFREQNSYKLRCFMNEMVTRFKLDITELSFMTESEIISVLMGKIDCSGNVFKKRSENSAFIFMDDFFHILTDVRDLGDLDKILNKIGNKDIKGNVVYRGVVRGLAKIVISDKDFVKVNAGDVLVATTTRPSFLPSMQKAAAFVTNEGGMLSHAAIIAREMKKPCIVGTKIATKVLRDGDYVEVNADKGVVTILKRAEKK